jgi:hypothetical protein
MRLSFAIQLPKHHVGKTFELCLFVLTWRLRTGLYKALLEAQL